MPQVAEPSSIIETLARVLVWFDASDSTYWAECIDSAGIAPGGSVEEALTELIPVVLDLADLAHRDGTAFLFEPRSDDLSVFDSAKSVSDDIGRSVVARATIRRQRDLRPTPRGREEFQRVEYVLRTGS